jgi:DNA replication protein DnaC
MSRTAVAKDMVLAQTRALKMPGAARVYEALGRQVREEHWSHEEYLHEVLAAEQTSRQDSAVRQRQRDARFPEVKTLDTFDFTANDGSVKAAQVTELARGGWIDRAENVILAGPIGTGKTHLAIALGLEAVRQRRRVPVCPCGRSCPLAHRGQRCQRAWKAAETDAVPRRPHR